MTKDEIFLPNSISSDLSSTWSARNKHWKGCSFQQEFMQIRQKVDEKQPEKVKNQWEFDLWPGQFDADEKEIYFDREK